MTPAAPESSPSASAEPVSPLRSVARFAAQTFAIVAVELRKLVRDPTELFTRAVQPTLWLLVFGTVMSKMRGIGTGSVPYLDFMAPGILAQSVLFSAIFYGIAVIWERDLGLVHKLLASPAYRPALVLGKALAAGLRGLVQATIILVIALAMAVDVRLDPLSLLGVVLTVILGSALFATFSLVIACLVKTRERFMGVGQLMTMPLFFASNAIYPLELMPGWLRVIAGVNPLTYLVDALRTLMVHGTTSAHGLVADFAVLVSGFLVVLWIASRLYPGLAR